MDIWDRAVEPDQIIVAAERRALAAPAYPLRIPAVVDRPDGDRARGCTNRPVKLHRTTGLDRQCPAICEREVATSSKRKTARGPQRKGRKPGVRQHLIIEQNSPDRGSRGVSAKHDVAGQLGRIAAIERPNAQITTRWQFGRARLQPSQIARQ